MRVTLRSIDWEATVDDPTSTVADLPEVMAALASTMPDRDDVQVDTGGQIERAETWREDDVDARIVGFAPRPRSSPPVRRASAMHR